MSVPTDSSYEPPYRAAASTVVASAAFASLYSPWSNEDSDAVDVSHLVDAPPDPTSARFFHHINPIDKLKKKIMRIVAMVVKGLAAFVIVFALLGVKGIFVAAILWIVYSRIDQFLGT